MIIPMVLSFENLKIRRRWAVKENRKTKHNILLVDEDKRILHIEDKQFEYDLEQVVKKLNAARFKEITTAETERDGEVNTRHGFRDVEEARDVVKNESEGVGETEDARQLASKMYIGVIKLLIAKPVNYVQIRRFHERLEQVEGFQVKSVGGSSSEGPNIIIIIKQPVPLLERLSQIDLIERVSEGRKGVEVTLRPEH
jgi:hypothetical protein